MKATRSKRSSKSKISGVKAELFGKTRLPEWDADEFFRLHQLLVKDEASKDDQDKFSRLLMRFILMRLRSKVAKRAKALEHMGIRSSEVVVDLASHLYQRFSKYQPNEPHPLVLVKCMDTAIGHMISGMARSAERAGADLASDVFQHVDGDALGLQFSGTEDRSRPTLVAQQLARDDEDFVADAMHQPKDATSLRLAWRYIVRQLSRNRGVKPLSYLQNRLRTRISNEQYTLLVARARAAFSHRLFV